MPSSTSCILVWEVYQDNETGAFMSGKYVIHCSIGLFVLALRVAESVHKTFGILQIERDSVG